MNTIETEDRFSPEYQDELRASVRAEQDRRSASQADIAKLVGESYSTFSAWLNNTYKGNNGKVAANVERWLESAKERETMAAALPGKIGFQPTPTAEHMLSVCQFAQTAPDVVVIAGGAGVGKTTAFQHYQKTSSNVWLITMEPSTATMVKMMREIAYLMGVQERADAGLSRAIGRKVRGTGGLMIVDEAQHLCTEALDQLRVFNDRDGIGIGIVIGGNETVYARLEGDGRKPAFAQLFSRLGMRHTQPKPRDKDISTLIAAWGISETRQTKLLTTIARKPGALRLMTKTLQLATMLAAGTGGERGYEHIRAAYERLTAEQMPVEA